MTELRLADASAQTALGEHLGRSLAAYLGQGPGPGSPGPLVVYLEGDLGTGKTTLVRGILKGLGHRGPVRSPTYTLIEPYGLATGAVYHLDLYRLASAEELEYLGLRDLASEESLLLVEWPERGAGALPPPDLRLFIRYLDEGRSIALSAETPAGRRLLDQPSGGPEVGTS